MEHAVYAQDDVEPDDGDLDGEVEEVEAGFAVVPGGIVARARDVGYAGAEGGAEG